MVEVKKKKNNTLPKKTVYSKIFGKERVVLPPDHPMFCCQHFQGCVLDKLDIAVAYNPQYRLNYWVTSKGDTSIRWLTYCPSCGKQWPRELTSEFFEELEKVVGHEIVYIEYDWSTLPEEFKSEEWWRKRGL